MINEMQSHLNLYVTWLKDKSVFRQVEDWIEIDTPYLDRHNDYLQIYAKKENGGITLTDAGYIIEDLAICGCSLDSPKRNALLKQILNGFGVLLEGTKLLTKATNEDFPVKKHNLIQSMLAVNDLFYLSKPSVTSLFLDDVTNWLEIHEIRYIPRIKFSGKTGFDYLFDFVIPKSNKYPERIIKTINHPDKDSTQSMILSWIDTRETRPNDSIAFAILNDMDHILSSSVLSALKNYDLQPIPWSKRGEFVDKLAV